MVNFKFNIFTLLLIISIAQNVAGEALICNVTTAQGILAGESIDLVTGEGKYCSFKGIPYAQPPIGKLRFKAPLPASNWTGVRNATEHGSVCPQTDILTNEYIPGNESCLFLNVYSPNVTCSNMSVLFFIHGGGYKSGSGNVDSFGPDFFLRPNFNIVVVTINYRLDALGFLSLETKEVPGNAGLKDQVMALKWVKTNIKYFGGNPDKVTIMGQSAGAGSVGLHMASPMSVGLFRRAIALSGSPYNDWSLAYHPKERALKFAQQIANNSVEIGNNTDAALTILQNATWDKFINYTAPNVLASEQITAVITKEYQFTPVVEFISGDNNFLSENLLLKNFSHVNHADIMFGYTNQEGVTALSLITGTLMALYKQFIENFATRKLCEYYAPDFCLEMGTKVRNYYFGNKSIDVNTTKEFVNYVNEGNFQYDIVRFYSQFPNNGTKYMYQFSSQSKRNQYGVKGVEYGIYGAGHIDDLSNLFDPKSRNLTLDLNSTEFQIIKRFTNLIRNFVHYGNPTPNSSYNIPWPEFNSTTMSYVDIGTTNLTILSLQDKPYYNFWQSLLKSYGLTY